MQGLEQHGADGSDICEGLQLQRVSRFFRQLHHQLLLLNISRGALLLGGLWGGEHCVRINPSMDFSSFVFIVRLDPASFADIDHELPTKAKARDFTRHFNDSLNLDKAHISAHIPARPELCIVPAR